MNWDPSFKKNKKGEVLTSRPSTSDWCHYWSTFKDSGWKMKGGKNTNIGCCTPWAMLLQMDSPVRKWYCPLLFPMLMDYAVPQEPDKHVVLQKHDAIPLPSDKWGWRRVRNFIDMSSGLNIPMHACLEVFYSSNTHAFLFVIKEWMLKIVPILVFLWTSTKHVTAIHNILSNLLCLAHDMEEFTLISIL